MATAELPAEPYTCVLSAGRQDAVRLAVGRREGRDARCATLATSGRDRRSASIPTRWRCRATARGCSSPAPTRTPCGSSISPTRSAAEQISRRARIPRRRPGSTPNALALSPDGRTLLVANADNNTVTIVDVSTPGASAGEGLDPGRLVSDRRAVRPRRHAAVRARRQGADRRGRIRAARSPAARASRGSTAAAMFQGAHVDRSRCPTAAALERYDARRSTRLTPYTDAHRLAPADAPARVADSAPRRRHVADQARLLHHSREPHLRPGARRHAERGNGDPSLTLFGEDVTPNAHALAREFVAVRQFLRRRRGQLRRPRVLDRRLRDRFRREDVADQLRPPRGART